ncbi:MAG TPA: bifunctional phosphoribosylaminoimidazolecarboxamide formyltransferase/IMP cyclohydrolase, partial [Vicinamibacterales bacterium]|nr:bifunctional phosphoribosylaminoimidazolecarboxamide formyltransferase/IMP cyclohydrolase [Vicinamibacterales bacterium]
MKRALLSVSNKDGLADFAEGLSRRGFELISTGGTAKAIAAAGLPVTNVSDVTGFPEMMEGRVKTLHPLVHGGILARRDQPSHLASAAEHGIGLIDVVAVNLYPFARAAANPDTPLDALVEEIDIGGPSMVRAAAKNFRDVLVVVSPDDYARVLAALDEPAGPSLAFRFDLARTAFAHTAAYDGAIASTLEAVTLLPGGAPVRDPERTVGASRLVLALRKVRDLRYGENPHQPAAWYAAGEEGLGGALVLQGKELSYTNLLDLDSAARIAVEFTEPAAVVIKHTNPCGAATGDTIAEAYV